MDYDKCTISTTDSRVVVSENKSKFEVINSKKIAIKKVQVDGCLIQENSEKCDWIISIDTLNRVFFIELKGCNIDKAISQLKTTLVKTKSQYSSCTRECYAVTTRIPKSGTKLRKKQLDFFKETKTTLNIKNIRSSITV